MTAAEPLPRSDPPRLVVDRHGRYRIDVPLRLAACGRRRYDVDGVVRLPAMGAHLVAATFKRAAGRSERAWVGYSDGAKRLVAPLRGLDLDAVPPSGLPADLFTLVEGWLATQLGTTVLPDATRKALNAARWLVGAIPGCAHVDVTPDDFESRDKAQWTIVGNAPEPVAASTWGDAETERLVKRCSAEILGTVAGWNQLAGYMADGVVGAGPHGTDELLVAARMLHLDPTFPAHWEELAQDQAVGVALFALGSRIVQGWAAREDAGEQLAPAKRRTVRSWRKIEGGQPGWRKIGGRWTGCKGIMRAGWLAALAIAFPTREGMAPFAALFAIQSRLNVEPLLALPDTEFGIFDADAADPPSSAFAEPLPERLRGAPYKGRAHRPYPVDFPVTLEPDDPAPIIEFVRVWTSGIRDQAGRLAWSTFLYVGDLCHSGLVTSFAKLDYCGFLAALSDLCVRAGVPRITPRELRRIGIDLVHEACDGDPVTMRAAGDWRDLGTGERHYFGPAIVMRGQESLGWSMKIEDRRRDWGIDTAGRPRGGDLFSATDGFRCRNPLDGPDPQAPGELCRARGQCPLCRNGDVDVADPAWSFAQMASLADHIAVRLDRGASPAWTARNAPVLDELREFWLPYFPDWVVDEARRLPSLDYPELSQ